MPCYTIFTTMEVRIIIAAALCAFLLLCAPTQSRAERVPTVGDVDYATVVGYVPLEAGLLQSARGGRSGGREVERRNMLEEQVNATVLTLTIGEAYGSTRAIADYARTQLVENEGMATAGNCVNEILLSRTLLEGGISEITIAAALVGDPASRELGLERTSIAVTFLGEAHRVLRRCFRNQLAQAEVDASSNTGGSNPYAPLAFLLRAAKNARGAINSLLEIPLAEAATRLAFGWKLGTPDCPFTADGNGRALALCAMGYAEGTIGGVGGESVVVTDSSDLDLVNPKAGTLRWAVQFSPVWITFAADMTILLGGPLRLRSETTLDGRGVTVKIENSQILVASVADIIIHNLHIENVAGDYDIIHTTNMSTRVWVDHCRFENSYRGLLTVRKGATRVTVSNNHMHNENFVMLLGASDEDTMDKSMRVTVYRNYFVDSHQRMPHGRFGWFHVLNNAYSNWTFYAVGGRVGAKIITEKNVFVAKSVPEVTPWYTGCLEDVRCDSSVCMVSVNDLLENGATYTIGYPCQVTFTPPYFILSSDTQTLFNDVVTAVGPRIPAPPPTVPAGAPLFHR